MNLAPVVSIIGSEGAGKSTTVSNLSLFLSQQNISHAVIFMGRGKGNIIPLNKFGKNKEKYGENNTVPKTTFKKQVIYTLAAGALTLDFYLRYLFRIIPQRLQKEIIITDRYMTDLYNMPHVPLWLRKMALSLFPKPSLTFYLYHDLEVLHQRKGRSRADLEWQLQNFAVLSKKFQAVEIKTEGQTQTLEIIRKELTAEGILRQPFRE